MIHQMLDLKAIKSKVRRGEFEFSQHAVDQAIQRRISVEELQESIVACELLEDYPTDKYGPSCLLLGFTISARPLHVQVSYATRTLIKIITVYEPDPIRWIDHRHRRNIHG